VSASKFWGSLYLSAFVWAFGVDHDVDVHVTEIVALETLREAHLFAVRMTRAVEPRLVCGLVHSIFVTVPVTLMGLFASNSAAKA
jgi:hypothetical protein